MLLCRHRVTTPLVARARGVVDTKTHRARQEWQSKAYPRASTNEPDRAIAERLPRRGQRGGWMRNPSKGVAKLDGTNFKQQEWWTERADEVDRTFISELHQSQSSGSTAPAFQKVLDKHLAHLDALSVEKPSANDFLHPHIKKLVQTPKVNPIHEATVMGPEGPIAPMAAVPEAVEPPFVGESLATRRQRRGRFLGKQKGVALTAGMEGLEGLDGRINAQRIPNLSRGDAAAAAQAAGWSENDGIADEFTEIGPKHGRKSSRKEADDSQVLAEDPQSATVPIVEPMEPTRYTSLGQLWATHGASWVIFNACMVPSTFPPVGDSELVAGSTLEEYWHTRKAASLFDLSYKVGLRVTGTDREFVADQFLTCNLRAMRVGDAQYACVLDTKGLVLDDSFVYITEESVEIIVSGCHSRQLVDYLGQYVVYVRRSGADVALQRSPRTVSVALQGPKASEALARAMNRVTSAATKSGLPWHGLETPDAARVELSSEVLEDMPYMSVLGLGSGSVKNEGHRVVALRAGTTGEDGFEILAPPGEAIMRIVDALLADESTVRPAGIYCLDMLRMEAGLPRTGSDIPAGTVTPIRASLAWSLDQSKMRSHLMFGWEKLFRQLASGPRFRRIALILDGPAHGGCRILSNPHRQPIGQITSTAWSPALQARVGMGYVKPEYAKAKKDILVTVPYNLPTHKMRKKAIQRWIKQGPLRSAYRRIVAAVVVPLPLVPHNYPEPMRQRKALARQRHFVPDNVQGQEPLSAAKSATSTSTGTARAASGKVKHPQPRAPKPGRRALETRVKGQQKEGTSDLKEL